MDAERGDQRRVGFRQALPGFHCLDVVGHAAERAFDERERIDSEYRENEINRGDRDPDPTSECDAGGDAFGQAKRLRRSL